MGNLKYMKLVKQNTLVQISIDNTVVLDPTVPYFIFNDKLLFGMVTDTDWIITPSEERGLIRDGLGDIYYTFVLPEVSQIYAIYCKIGWVFDL